MKRQLLYASMFLALAGSYGLAQGPRTAPQAEPAASPHLAQLSNLNKPVAAPANPLTPENVPVRQQLAAPLRNQFDAFGGREQEPELKADVVTPEMWLYQQEMRRYNDPRQAVRHIAASRAAHRRARLAAQQWFGYSNTRPQASPMPFLDMYSPTWISNSWNPYAWIGSGHAWSAVRVEPIVVTR